LGKQRSTCDIGKTGLLDPIKYQNSKTKERKEE
jgi:hypothetical protein